MAHNKNAVLAKLAKRGGSKAVARARRVVTAHPSGHLAQRLADAMPYTRHDISRKLPINARGSVQAQSVTGGVVQNRQVFHDTSLRYLRARMPGSPY